MGWNFRITMPQNTKKKTCIETRCSAYFAMGSTDADDDDADDLLMELLTYPCPLSGTMRTAGAPNHGKNLSIYACFALQ